MNLSQLHGPAGANKRPKRLGRGESSGSGKTSGRGHKGQHARTGGKVRPGFEGGQIPLIRRLPKTGFTNPTRGEYGVVNVADLERVFEAGATVDLESCKRARLVRSRFEMLKVLGDGELKKKLTVNADRVSAEAERKIAAAGGTSTARLARRAPKGELAAARAAAYQKKLARIERQSKKKKKPAESEEAAAE